MKISYKKIGDRYKVYHDFKDKSIYIGYVYRYLILPTRWKAISEDSSVAFGGTRKGAVKNLLDGKSY